MAKLEAKMFRTKVARKIFSLFILCAILPVSVLAAVSFVYVQRQLYRQTEERLRLECSAVAVCIYDRVLSLKSDITELATATVRGSLNGTEFDIPTVLPGGVAKRYHVLRLITGGNATRPTFSDGNRVREFTEAEERHLATGKTLIFLEKTSNPFPRVFMAVLPDPESTSRQYIVGEINKEYLWGSVKDRPPLSKLCILDNSGKLLFSTFPPSVSFPDPKIREMAVRHAGQFEFSFHDKAYLASYRTIYTKSNFLYPEWKVLISEAKEHIEAPMAVFRRAFPLVLLISLGVVFLLSVSQIRKNLAHIESLKSATQKISEGVFGHKVHIKSGDEFETLSTAFNNMSERLQKDQALLVQNEKMSVLGKMGAGIVHEIKQPLNVISPTLQMMLYDEESKEKRDRLEMVLSSVEKMDGILQKFKSLSFFSKKEMTRLSITYMTGHIIKVFEHQFLINKITLSTEIDEGPLYIYGENESIEQVFMNLIVNAMDALEEKGEGQRTIHVKAYRSEDTVVVEIGDNGCGMSEEIQKRLFDPFFTTKDAGKGTGLGMAIAGSILSGHDAKIEVKTEVNKGTLFKIMFPSAS